MNSSLLFYDCEIAKLIPDRGGYQMPGYKFCKGWGDFKGMGIAVIGYYSSLTGTYDHARNPDIFEGIANSHDLIVGFNSRSFDDQLLAANGVKLQTHYDLLEEIRFAAYGSTSYRDCPKGCTYKLDALDQANGGVGKKESGALAPKLWQDGERQRVIDYCIDDCRISMRILELGLSGKLVDPNNGRLLQLRPLPAVKTQLSLL